MSTRITRRQFVGAAAGVAAGRTQCPPRCPRDGHTNVDFRVTDVFSIRAIKLDYLPVFIDDFDAVGVSFSGRTQRNFRAGAGLVFHF